METNKNTALVVGANGVIGTNLIDYLLSTKDWNVIGLSRKGGIDRENLQFISVDLLDIENCKKQLSELKNITHIFYTAYQDRPTWSELVEPNMKMLHNVVETIEPISENLQHISLMQGYKVYGAHLGPFKTPAKENDAGHMPPEFNASQQQYLERKQEGKKWSWSAIRPSVVGGTALGNPMNLALLIAVYASISKELNIPLRFPGKIGAYEKLMEMTDAGLLAKATVWAATNPKCANQAFNITNGDLFRWQEIWPKIANYFEIPVAQPLQMELKSVMADKDIVWKDIQEKYNLEKHNYEKLAAWEFGDFVFSWDYDFFSNGIKARRFGFHEFIDTEEMFFGLFDEFRRKKIIP
ncbi:NAD-dependent epimerase/dehydratase family protein [Flavobacterium sp. GN10]|uniref:NAD-dependent epimerase/dehydratase family protein n=1 Tax=Flavobacterium tagetis TaxID=2801336 RepID=A0ABS1KGU9_9FLAO|nr:SDR family oxidoreductase [Flavobacterium tagetis]MBL0738590.1 NAD-dependent epimerase/dehydratase family protein [Flavobacterium tagetis]